MLSENVCTMSSAGKVITHFEGRSSGGDLLVCGTADHLETPAAGSRFQNYGCYDAASCRYMLPECGSGKELRDYFDFA